MASGWLRRLFPPIVTSVFPGRRIALWLFAPLTLVTLWRSRHHLVAAETRARGSV